jgi:hypothetical protein
MVSNRASCMVMGVSISAFYLPLVSPILSSFNILEEFLLYQTFEEEGEFAKLAIAIIFSKKSKDINFKRIFLICKGMSIVLKLMKVFNCYLLFY